MHWFYNLNDKEKIRVILSLFSYRSYKDCEKSELEFLLSKFIGIDVEIEIPTMKYATIIGGRYSHFLTPIVEFENEEIREVDDAIYLCIGDTWYYFNFPKLEEILTQIRKCYDLEGIKFYEKLLYRPNLVKSAIKKNLKF